MTKKLCSLVVAALLLLTAAGCSSVFEDEHYYETTITGDFGALSDNATEIRNYGMLKTALTGMISQHEEQSEFRLNNYNGSPNEDLARACFEVKSENPLGAYAVESLSYDTSYVVSYYMATIYISYKRTAEEMENIFYASTQQEFDDCIRRAVEESRPRMVARIYSSAVDEEYIGRLVKQIHYDDPIKQVTEPIATVESYPATGANRIYDIQLNYNLPLDKNATMTLALAGQLGMAAAEMKEKDPARLALESAEYLSRLCADTKVPGAYKNTAYGAFVEQYADAKGFALAYSALCRRLGIECMIVEGSVGAMGADTHYWNIISVDGKYYHVDVSAMEDGPAGAFLLNDDAMWGQYIWETEEYPVCDGEMTYFSLVPPPESASEGNETETPAEQSASLPEESPDFNPAETGGQEKDEKTP